MNTVYLQVVFLMFIQYEHQRNNLQIKHLTNTTLAAYEISAFTSTLFLHVSFSML